MTDSKTVALYDAQAEAYADRVTDPEASPRLKAFIAALPEGARALDLGCGPGNSAAAMVAAGLDVDALDAASGMVAVAQTRFGVNASQGTFFDVDTTRAYHGIWANFSLLHAPRAEMPDHLARLHEALAPGGLLHIGLKTGTGDHRDDLGRHYTYYTDAEITALLAAAGFTVTERETGRDKGFDGAEADWMVLWARRS